MAFFIMEDLRNKITEEDVRHYTKKRGAQNASKLLSILGKKKQFLNAWESPIGQELMSQLLIDAERLLEKIIENKATPDETAEFRVIRRWLVKVEEKITSYYHDLNTLKGAK